MTDPLADLYRCHDGSPPRPALGAARAGGAGRRSAVERRCLHALHQRLAAQARAAVAARRSVLTRPGTDVWLDRLVATMCHHRMSATALLPAAP